MNLADAVVGREDGYRFGKRGTDDTLVCIEYRSKKTSSAVTVLIFVRQENMESFVVSFRRRYPLPVFRIFF